MKRSICNLIPALVVGLFLQPFSALAQITVGTMAGRIVDASGAVVVAAKVDLVSETQNTKTAAVITNADGDYVIPNLAPDTYTIEVSAPSFKILRTRRDRGYRRRSCRRAAASAGSGRNHRDRQRERRSGAPSDTEF